MPTNMFEVADGIKNSGPSRGHPIGIQSLFPEELEHGAGGDAALQMVRDITASAEIGKTYLGKVVRLAEFGAFVELFPGTDGLLHISEISEHRIRDVRDELKLGDQVLVKVLAIEGNKVRLSRKALIKEAREKQQKAAGAGATTAATSTTEDTSTEADANISE